MNLVKRHSNYLKYVVVHELDYLIELQHNYRFKELLDKYYPNCSITKDELNKFIWESYKM